MTQLICFEGLSPFLIGTPSYIGRGLLGQLNFDLELAGVNVWRGSFMSSGPAIGLDVNQKLIVIGHSMGGASAIRWCNDYLGMVDLLITLDPRPLHRPYIKPANVKRAVNFYRNAWWMRGYPVENAENHVVTCGHGAVPGLPEVRALVEAHL